MKLESFKETMAAQKEPMQACVIDLSGTSPYEYRNEPFKGEKLFDLLNKKPIPRMVEKTVQRGFLFWHWEKTVVVPNRTASDIFAYIDEYSEKIEDRYLIINYPKRDILYDNFKSKKKKYTANGLISAVRNKLKVTSKVGVIVNNYCHIISR